MASGKVEGPALPTLWLKPFPLHSTDSEEQKQQSHMGIEHPFALAGGFQAQQP